MARQQSRLNGGETVPLVPFNTPVIIPVKSEAQLLMEVELDRLRRENEALRNRPVSRLSMKISEKGALSIYGMGRFPVTLYREQWEKLLGMSDEIKAFIVNNSHTLKVKE